jgi:hypothetical protein
MAFIAGEHSSRAFGSDILVKGNLMQTQDQLRSNFEEALRLMDDFASGTAPAQRAARKVAARLQELEIPYVIAGGLAVAARGYMRVTVDVDLILTREGLARFKERSLGLGWVEKFKGSKGMRDAEFRVNVDVLTPNEKPGDGKSCPFNFPNPASLGEEVGGIWSGLKVLPLRELIELKLASGLTSVGRLKDLADVMELIKVNKLPVAFGQKLHPFVQSKYADLWTGAQVKDPYEE